MVWCELHSEKQIIVYNSSMFQRRMICTLLESGLGDGGVMGDSMGPVVMGQPKDTITNTLYMGEGFKIASCVLPYTSHTCPIKGF